MEPQIVQTSAYKEEAEPAPDKASQRSPTRPTPSMPRRALRGRGAGRPKTEVPCAPDTNGAAASAPGCGRVLRDRSTRAVPAWRQSDIGEDKEAPSRRKAVCPRRKRTAEPARERGSDGGPAAGSEEIKDGGASTRGEADKVSGRKAGGSGEKKSEREEDDVPLGEEEPPFMDDPKDQTYQPQSQSDDEDVVTSDEDEPFRDDLNDQSYDPKSERDTPKPRRRAPPRPREKKEKVGVGEKERMREAEVKTEGGEGLDVKVEFGEGAEPPRKRGRRRKDDKSPRLPKRSAHADPHCVGMCFLPPVPGGRGERTDVPYRKKPPVQYVRCEMEGCGTVLAHPRYLQHHIKYQHLMKKKYVCPHPSCGRLFRLQKQLLRHAKHHTDQRDYICEFCARAFKSSHNLAVHRMIHTGEKPLQCEICGFTCRQKASLNWHMKKHDADASYQFSCSICGKKFEKKDSVVAHKAKSHPEVLIAEALAANAGALITTPGALLEASAGPGRTEQVAADVQVAVSQVGSLAPVGPGAVTHMGPVMVVEQDHSLHGMRVPVTLALPAAEVEEGAASSRPTSTHTLQAVPLQCLLPSAPVSHQQQQTAQIQALPLQSSATVASQATLVQPLPVQSYASQSHILHMTFTSVAQQQQPMHQLPLLSVAPQLPLHGAPPQQSQTLAHPHNPGSAPAGPLLAHTLSEASSDCRSSLGFSAEPPPSSSSPSQQSSAASRQAGEGGAIWEGSGPAENGNVGGVWEATGGGEGQLMTDSSDGPIQHGLM
ncbi:hypothetical protein P4O66_013182 [Electrophorus voltai]|uniref:E3 ubiquitin-protein ligase ZFP91 n=1 Tax=Electrophorus voltai TaxID=2609070 RepID=A0AAD8Z2F3_9TELE|nr:hypothetical protein P4O66_013182 [Electrophorus voltai]